MWMLVGNATSGAGKTPVGALGAIYMRGTVTSGAKLYHSEVQGGNCLQRHSHQQVFTQQNIHGGGRQKKKKDC